MFEVVRDRSASEFFARARELLYQDEAINSLAIGLCDNLQMSFSKANPLLLRVTDNKRTVATAIHSAPMSLLLTKAPHQAIENLVRHLCVMGEKFAGVVGPAEETSAFTSLWSALTGAMVQLSSEQSIYRIDKVRISQVADGEFRLARHEDIAVLAEWTQVFAHETFGETKKQQFSYWRALVEKDVLSKKTFLWVKDGEPQSMASIRRPTRNGSSISSVYTPVGKRGQGYASSLVAHLSQRMLDDGKKFCVLYADRANVRAHKIYTDVGYEEVARSCHYLFEASSIAC